jgi:antitoxin component YwqK of YwqJK toxin-antitoxin module
MSIFLTLLTIILGINSLFANSETKEYTSSDYKATYSVKDGLLHGKYISYYPNGTKKAEGEYYYNNRKGTWKLWDKNGNLVIERKYENNFSFESILPKKDYYKYEPEINAAGHYDYYKLKEKDVIYSNLHHSIILKDNNEELFNNNILAILVNNRESENFKNYEVFDSFDAESFEINSTENLEIIAFEILYENIYDNERQLWETSINFISPVIKNNNTNQISHNYWFRFRKINPYLAENKINKENLPFSIKTVSDFFFWKQYSDIKIQCTNATSGNKCTSSSIDIYSDIELFNKFTSTHEELLIKEIETEHNLWYNIAISTEDY